MDPNATLRELLTAVFERDHETLRDAAADLAEWLKEDGFAPDPKKALDVIQHDWIDRA